MIHNANDNSTDAVTSQSKSKSSEENNSSPMSPTVPLSDPTGEPQPVHAVDQQPPNGVTEKESHESQALAIVENEDEQDQDQGEGEENDDEFIRITAAHQMLTEAQTYDEQKNYPAALHLYRICVDLLLEELMFTEGTDQSRVYLREKCTAIMDRIDRLKTMLEPIPAAPLPLAGITNDEATSPPSDELSSLHLA